MRHRKAGLKLNRTPSHRNAMFRNMVTSLFKYDRIRTTGAKAKELRRWADHLVTLAKRGDLHARRQALAIVREKDVVHKLFENAGDRFGAISGGYTRVIKLGRRPGDAAPIALVELVVAQDTKKKKTKKKKTKSEPAPTKAAVDKKAADAGQKEPKKAAPADQQDESAMKSEETAKGEVAAPVEDDTAKVEEKAELEEKTVEAADEEKAEKKTKAVPKEAAAPEEEDAPDTKKTAKDKE